MEEARLSLNPNLISDPSGFEIHCHTYYSKGKIIPWEAMPSPKELVRHIARLGLRGVAITDHSTIRAWKEAEEEAKKLGLVFIPSVEISTRDGHIIGHGLNEKVKDGLPAEETADLIRSQGGIAVAPHPYDIKGDGINHKIALVDAVEGFNSLNFDRFSNKFAQRQARKLNKPMVCGSDAHTLEMLGTSVNFIDAYSTDEFIKQLKKGLVTIQRNYMPVRKTINWARERMARSYKDILGQIESYSPAKAWLAKGMLDKFVTSRSRFFYGLAGFGMAMSCIYGSIRILKFY